MAKAQKGIFLRGNVYWIRFTDILGKQQRESSTFWSVISQKS